MKYLFFLLILFSLHGAFAQVKELEGKIIDRSSKEAIPFANVFNRSAKKGTISNTDGYFKIEFEKWTDTITVNAVGYKSQRLVLDEKTSFYLVKVVENVTELGEVTVKPQDNTYLYRLLTACRNQPNKIKQEAKSYYELKTVIDDQQIELVEGFFNTEISGYELSGQKLKAGRIAMKTYDEQMRMFVSAESSKAILLSKVMSGTDYFPANPFSMNYKKMRQNFYLDLENKYLDENQDSIAVIRYAPKPKSENAFSGKIWLNLTRSQLVKQTMNCENCQTHPFLPLFETDSILAVDLQITKTFEPKNGKQLFHHVDFNYTIAYKSRFGDPAEQQFLIKTNALLYAYDYDETFFIPKFEFNKTASDYRKILSLPVNEFFWKFNDEYRLNDKQNSNLKFFSDSMSLTNTDYFMKTGSPLKKGFFQEPYIKWSDKRILFRESIADTLLNEHQLGTVDRSYNLSVKVFLDRNAYQDSTDILTCTIFDPYESYYLLPTDEVTHCFMNIYFDLCEIERRKFEDSVKGKQLGEQALNMAYEQFLTDLNQLKESYLRSVDHGRNKQALIKWNELVSRELKIDNMVIFGLSKGK